MGKEDVKLIKYSNTMTSQEILRMPTPEFFQAIADAFEAADKFEHYATNNENGAKMFAQFIGASQAHARRAEIQHRAAARIRTWAKKMVTAKMLTL